jgi:hypothetical protein
MHTVIVPRTAIDCTCAWLTVQQGRSSNSLSKAPIDFISCDGAGCKMNSARGNAAEHSSLTPRRQSSLKGPTNRSSKSGHDQCVPCICLCSCLCISTSFVAFRAVGIWVVCQRWAFLVAFACVNHLAVACTDVTRHPVGSASFVPEEQVLRSRITYQHHCGACAPSLLCRTFPTAQQHLCRFTTGIPSLKHDTYLANGNPG